MHLNHPQTIPPPAWSMGKLSSSKQVLGAKKFGDCSGTTCDEHLVGATTSWLLLVLILAGKERHKEILTQMAQRISHGRLLGVQPPSDQRPKASKRNPRARSRRRRQEQGEERVFAEKTNMAET